MSRRILVSMDLLRPQPTTAQPGRFYDGGTDEEAPDLSAPPRIVLERDLRDDDEVFRMLRRIAYLDEEYGEILVPAGLAEFRTDLTSVPALFTWLVPRTGEHLPAALLHDGLVHGPGEPADYVSSRGHVIDRVAGDRIFRSAMRDTHTAAVRRWLIWSAVTLATIWRGSARWSRGEHLRRRLVAVLTLAVIGVLGIVATLDLVDVVDWLPWMGERPFPAELAGGLAGAIAIPLLLGLAWGRFAVAGVVVGIAFAVLFHVTLALAAITMGYRLCEAALARWPRTSVIVALAGGVLAVVVTAVLTAA